MTATNTQTTIHPNYNPIVDGVILVRDSDTKIMRVCYYHGKCESDLTHTQVHYLKTLIHVYELDGYTLTLPVERG